MLNLSNWPNRVAIGADIAIKFMASVATETQKFCGIKKN